MLLAKAKTMKIKLSKKIILLIVIIFVGSFFRLYKLGQIPNGFYVDEAAIGYNAYSLLKTGKDEYGKVFPVFLRSYGAYAPPLYAYTSIIPIALLGPTVFSVRFVSALAGIIIILLVYLLLESFKLSKANYFSLLGAFFFAISPWNIFFSRGAFEANLAFLLILSAVYFLIKAARKLVFLIPASFLLALSTYAYQAERLVSYLIIISFFVVYLGCYFRRHLFKKEIIISILLFIVLQIPQISLFFSPAFKIRASGLFYGEAIANQAKNIHLPRLISYPLAFTREFSANFISYFSPRNLFWVGDSDLQRGLPEMGPLYFWMVIPYLIGLFAVAKRYKEKNIFFLILLALSFAIVPSLTKDPFSTLRSLPLSFPIITVIGLGAVNLWENKYKKLILFTGAFLLLISLVLFWRSYFVLLPNERAKIWGYGFNQLAEEIQKRPNEKFLIDQSRTKPVYIELAFFMSYPPEVFHQEVDSKIRESYYSNVTFTDNYQFANIETRGIVWEKDIYKEQILVGDEFSVSEGQAREHFLTKVFEIRDPTGIVVFVGYRTNPEEKCINTRYESELCNK